MRTTFNGRRGLFYGTLIGGGIAAAIVAAMFFTNSRELRDAPFIAVGAGLSWGSIAFVLGALKTAGSQPAELTRPTIAEWIVEMIWRTFVGLFVGVFCATIVEAAGVAVLVAVYGDVVVPASALMTWKMRLGWSIALAAMVGSLVGAMTGAWICRGRIPSTPIRGSVFGICLGSVTGIVSPFFDVPTFLFVSLGSGAISGIAGGIIARMLIPPPPTNPLPADLSTAIESRPSRELS